MKPFVLCGFPRTGTTVVSGSLLAHPEILLYGEIFNETPEVRRLEAMRVTMGAGWKLDAPMPYGVQPCGFDQSGAAWLEALLSRDALPFRATGFKLMYDQVTRGANGDVWDYIARSPEVAIIRTTRTNLLESICSYARAKLTRHWHATGGEMPSPRFAIRPAEFEAMVRRFETMPAQMRQVEQTHAVLELDYERISSDFQGCMADVYAFLDVSPVEAVTPRLKKIARLKPYEELANYADLKQHFAGSSIAKYFIY